MVAVTGGRVLRAAGRSGCVSAIAMFAAAAFAHQTSGTLAVVARVSPSAAVAFEISAQPVDITGTDVDRGYVDVVMKSRTQVTTGRGDEIRPPMVMGVLPLEQLRESLAIPRTGEAHGGGNGASKTAAVDFRLSAGTVDASGGRVSEFRYRFELRKGAEGKPTAISVAIDL